MLPTPKTNIEKYLKAISEKEFIIDGGGGNGGSSSDWNSITNKPSVYPPTEHSHSIDEVVGLVSELNNKLESVGWTDVLNKPSIPSKTSDLTNDSGFIDSNVLQPINSDLAQLETDLINHSGDIATATSLGHIKGGGNITIGSDGTLNTRTASTSQSGVVQLTHGTSSTSTTTAATPSSVKSAYDLASEKYSKPSTGIPLVDLTTTLQTSINKIPTIESDLSTHLEQSEWFDATLINGWVGSVKFRKDTHNNVHLHIDIASGVRDTYTNITDVPVEFIPQQPFVPLNCICYDNNGVCSVAHLQIVNWGKIEIIVANNNTIRGYFVFEGVSE